MQFFLERKPQKKSLCELHKIPAKNSIDIELVFTKPFCGIFVEKSATFFNEKLVTISTGFSRTLTLVRSFWGGFLLFMVGIWEVPFLSGILYGRSFLFLYEVPVVP